MTQALVQPPAPKSTIGQQAYVRLRDQIRRTFLQGRKRAEAIVAPLNILNADGAPCRVFART